MKKHNIMEITLRDGSYVINFSFTSADTAFVCKELEEIGFEYIEIGHGVGLNATNKGYGQAAATDEEHMVAAEGALRKAKYGMFCIPGIARLEDIDLAAKHNMGFIRIGTNVTEVQKSEEFIKRAKDYGMFVAANYMKSYVSSPEQFAQNVLLSEKYGADMVYIVDSAGGMFPSDVRRYFESIRKASNIDIGFHGHDNLGMSISNSVEAFELGALFVDSSMQGLGRSSGNACSEVLVAALKKRGHEINVDLRRLFELGQNFVQPLLSSNGKMPLDIISGYSDFHSSYMPAIQKCSAKYRIDPILLILEWTKIDKVNLDQKLLEDVAQQIKKEEKIYLTKYGFERYVGGEQDERKI
ncbi:4-hydroxy-2-oxovalerate aldolase [Candidatus Micrarchaeota archaeon]|nr:4-hydroxy-2-oxovalerate aldolase [Candidatus Micrarchaeota archaeon]